MAEKLASRGDNVVATARRPETLADLVAKFPNLIALPLDVTDQTSIKDAIDDTFLKFGPIDVLVNNAGYGQMGVIEEVLDEEVRIQFETNVFGLLNVTRAILPQMRDRHSGVIVNLSSIAGLVAFHGVGIYNASKFAVEAISEALAKEVEEFGIRVLIVEPGAFRTRFHNTQSVRTPEPRIPAYAEANTAIKQRMLDFDGQQPGDPEKAVDAMIAAADDPKAPLRLLLGTDAYENATRKLKEIGENFEQTRAITTSMNV